VTTDDSIIMINVVGNVDLPDLQVIRNGDLEISSSGDIFLINLLVVQNSANGNPFESSFKATGVNLYAGKLTHTGDMVIIVSNSIDLSSLEWINSMRIVGGGTLTLSNRGLRVEKQFWMMNIKIENIHLDYAETASIENNPTLTTITGNPTSMNIIQAIDITNNPAFKSFSGSWRLKVLYIDNCKSFFQPSEGSPVNIVQKLSIIGSDSLAHLDGFWPDPDFPNHVEIYLENVPVLGDGNRPVIIKFHKLSRLFIKNAPRLGTLDLAKLSDPGASIFLSKLDVLNQINMNLMEDGKCPFNTITINDITKSSIINIFFRIKGTFVPVQLEFGGIILYCTDSGTVMKRCSSGNVVANLSCP
jgi:hypothetical protein